MREAESDRRETKTESKVESLAGAENNGSQLVSISWSYNKVRVTAGLVDMHLVTTGHMAFQRYLVAYSVVEKTCV